MLSKDDYYEIEKICDVYAGWIADRMNTYCNTAMSYDGKNALRLNKGDLLPPNPMDESIDELREAQDKVKRIRVKLEKMRRKE